MRQQFDIAQEFRRVTANKDIKKVGYITLSLNYVLQLNSDAFQLSLKLMEKLSKLRDQRTFGLGAMAFDDYNYKQLNDYIFNLVQSTLNSEDHEDNGS